MVWGRRVQGWRWVSDRCRAACSRWTATYTFERTPVSELRVDRGPRARHKLVCTSTMKTFLALLLLGAVCAQDTALHNVRSPGWPPNNALRPFLEKNQKWGQNYGLHRPPDTPRHIVHKAQHSHSLSHMPPLPLVTTAFPLFPLVTTCMDMNTGCPCQQCRGRSRCPESGR